MFSSYLQDNGLAPGRLGYLLTMANGLEGQVPNGHKRGRRADLGIGHKRDQEKARQ